MIQEYWDSFCDYIFKNRVALSTVATVFLLMGVVIYAWIRRVYGKPTREDWYVVFKVVGIFAIPMSMFLVVALVISGLDKFYKFIFAL